MFNMSWKITIGNFRLMYIEDVSIKHSVEELADTATITLPATMYNKSLDVENKLARGNKVTIELGYNDNLKTEFEGYIESITTDGGAVKLICEDEIFQYRKSIPDTQLKNNSVADILKYVNSNIDTSFGLDCDYSFTYDTFTIKSNTGYDILKKIQEEAKPNVYVKDKKLHIHPRYAQTFGNAQYDFSVNIESADLKYRKEDERKYMVEINGKGSDGKPIKIQQGTSGGDKETINISAVSSTSSLTQMAKEILICKVFTGYEGNFTGWLIPYCDAGYEVSIRDKEYEYKNGKYYAIAVETTFAQSGAKRKITLGKKLSDL